MPSVIDTQVMAAFAGIGDQVGFATLANELLGLSLGKEQQWTDWAARPLSAAQLAYAAADVRYLPAIYGKLAARLGERLAWARDESAGVAAEAMAAAAVTPDTAWREVGGLRGLDAASLAAVVTLAAWRQRVCIELDRPLGQVLHDKQLVELARQRPASAAAVRGTKGLTGLARSRADDILAAIAAAKPDEVTAIAVARPPSLRAQRWSEILLAIVHLIADERKLAPRLLATRSDAEELARAVDERGLAACNGLPAMTGWRRAVLGDAWRGWLTGERVLVGDLKAAQGVRLVAR
jgi:ribonuclease D